MKTLYAVLLVVMMLALCVAAQASTVYEITFDQGVSGTGGAPTVYTAGVNELIPAGMAGVRLNFGGWDNATSDGYQWHVGYLIDPITPGIQGGQALIVNLAAMWPNKQGYYFGHDDVLDASGNYGPHTYIDPVIGCPDPVGVAGPVINNDFTVEAVVWPNFDHNPIIDFGLSAQSTIYDSMRLDEVVGGIGVSIDQNTGILTFTYPGGTIASTPLAASQWYHVAAVVRSGGSPQTELYVNGNLEGTGVYPTTAMLPGYFTIGTAYWGTTQTNWQGLIDALAISDAALDPNTFVLKAGGLQVGTVSGKVVLSDFSDAKKWLVPIGIEASQGGVVKLTERVDPQADGSFTTKTALAGGDYDVAISAASFLKTVVHVSVNGPTTIADPVTLVNGDINGDGAIGLLDLGVLKKGWGKHE
jgi:hypothetical protein